VRCFFGKYNNDFSELDELGGSREFEIPTYQLDRGVLENQLANNIQALGVTLLDGANIKDISVDTQKVVTLEDRTISSKWLIDCAGRKSFIKNKLALHKENGHGGNAVWFRIDKRIEIDSWSDNTNWHAACKPAGKRWLSTNHLMGPGYWVWIIPLESGVTSIGIVMDDIAFEKANIKDASTAMSWLSKNQEILFESIGDAKFLDFVAISDYSYSCKQVFSGDKWGISGEAGYFSDPLYSPGTDFIAFGNCFIKDLIISDSDGEDTLFKSAIYQKIFNSFFDNTLSVYQGIYGGFGDRKLMGLKLLWDYSYYWGILGLLFFQNTFTDTNFIRKHIATLQKSQKLNQEVQQAFQMRAKKRQVLPTQGVFMDLYEIPCLRHLNTSLNKQSKNVELDLIVENGKTIEEVASLIKIILNSNSPMPHSGLETDLLGDFRKSLVV